MRLTGWCEKCHKIRTVRVTRMHSARNVQTGICAACELEQDREREERFRKQQQTRRKNG